MSKQRKEVSDFDTFLGGKSVSFLYVSARMTCASSNLQSSSSNHPLLHLSGGTFKGYPWVSCPEEGGWRGSKSGSQEIIKYKPTVGM